MNGWILDKGEKIRGTMSLRRRKSSVLRVQSLRKAQDLFCRPIGQDALSKLSFLRFSLRKSPTLQPVGTFSNGDMVPRCLRNVTFVRSGLLCFRERLLHRIPADYQLHSWRNVRKSATIIAGQKRMFLPVQSAISITLPTARRTSMGEIPHGYCKKEGRPLYLLGIEVLFSVSIQAEAMLAVWGALRMGCTDTGRCGFHACLLLRGRRLLPILKH